MSTIQIFFLQLKLLLKKGRKLWLLNSSKELKNHKRNLEQVKKMYLIHNLSSIVVFLTGYSD